MLLKIPVRSITSSQTTIHPKLPALLSKHLNTPFQKPLHTPSLNAYTKIANILKKCSPNIILDSGCGVGLSTLLLALQYPDSLIIGVDKSSHRLSKNGFYRKKIFNDTGAAPANVHLLQADLVTFWQLLHKNKIKLRKHYLLYPSLWPKQTQLKRRWHGHPVFPLLPGLSSTLELRSNWKIYLEEFNYCWQQAAGQKGALKSYKPRTYFTPFEAKYWQAGQTLWQLKFQDSKKRVNYECG